MQLTGLVLIKYMEIRGVCQPKYDLNTTSSDLDIRQLMPTV